MDAELDQAPRRISAEEKARRHRERVKKCQMLSKRIYFHSQEELDRYEQLAKKAGYWAFSQWAIQMLSNAAGGSLYPPDYVEALKAEVDRLRRWMETAREEAEDYKQQVKRLQSQRDGLLFLVSGLPNGPEMVARFLQQQSAGERS